MVEAFLSGGPASPAPYRSQPSGPAQGPPGWDRRAPAPPPAAAPPPPVPPPQAPPEHAKPSHLTGAWTNEDDGRYPEPPQGFTEQHGAVDASVPAAPASADTHGSGDPSRARPEVSQAEAGPGTAEAEPSVPPSPGHDSGPEVRGAFGPPPPYARTDAAARAEESAAAAQPTPAGPPAQGRAATPEPSSATGDADPVPARSDSAVAESGGELHTPLPGGLEERIAAVAPVPGVVWKRVLFRATRGSVNLGT